MPVDHAAAKLGFRVGLSKLPQPKTPEFLGRNQKREKSKDPPLGDWLY